MGVIEIHSRENGMQKRWALAGAGALLVGAALLLRPWRTPSGLEPPSTPTAAGTASVGERVDPGPAAAGPGEAAVAEGASAPGMEASASVATKPKSGVSFDDPGEEDDLSKLPLAELLRRLDAIPSGTEWRERCIASGKWTFDHLQAGPPLVREIRKRFPNVEIPRESVAALLDSSYGSDNHDAGVSALWTWSSERLRAEIEALVKNPEGPFLPVLSQLIGVLANGEEPIPRETVIALIRSGNAELRFQGMMAAWSLDPPPLEDTLEVIRNDPDPRVRVEGVAWIGESDLPEETVVPVLTLALRDRDPDVRSVAIRELHRFPKRFLEAAEGLVADGGLDRHSKEGVARVFLEAGKVEELLRLDSRGEYLDALVEVARGGDPLPTSVELRRQSAKNTVRAIRTKAGGREFDQLRETLEDSTLSSSARLAALDGFLRDRERDVEGFTLARDLLLRTDTPADFRRALLTDVVDAYGESQFPDYRGVVEEVFRHDPNFWIREWARHLLEE